MNKRSIFLSIVLLCIQLNTVLAQITVADTRNDNFLPTHYNKEVQFEFKYGHKIQSPGTSRFIGLMTFAPWGENTGGAHYQLSFSDDNIFYRTGLPENSSWGDWKKFVIANASGNVGIGVATPSARLEVKSDLDKHSELHINTSSESSVSIIRFQNSNVNKWAFLSNYPVSSGNFVLYNYSNSSYALTINTSSQVGIGTTSMGNHKLAVNGSIGAREVKVEAGSWSDFVFEPGYPLLSLQEVESFIKQHNHLPDIPSAKEVIDNGIELGRMDAKLLQKIEELTLYILQQRKLINGHEEANKQQYELIEKLSEQISRLENAVREMSDN